MFLAGRPRCPAAGAALASGLLHLRPLAGGVVIDASEDSQFYNRQSPARFVIVARLPHDRCLLDRSGNIFLSSHADRPR
jgi:hypothetical protein